MPAIFEKALKLPDDERSTLLLVDDDEVFRRVLARALQRRGYAVSVAATVDTALASALEQSPEYAVVDLKMPGASGLVLIEKLIELDPNTRVVMLTGYASIATAIEAIKLGAIHYLAKPCDADQVVAALNKSNEGDSATPVSDSPLSVDRLEWEHIQRVLAEQQGNISATARALKMHRRTLQRKLGKRPTRE
ncbi:MAG: Response regulator PrrA [Candidatus Accumulibacter appositus]|uniref:Response regulator PrrA n=1 Tax=Candidatus Accumulibacter appositus TaxID=1454003 RepID=A0A011QPF3_9PROT|nr:response regulator transcription factor [Accumulibacter sp.]EXI80759.1 MAG: Response regulator PrrA [Candidatus Accumulibacter appositus]HRF06223.1 response regulator transcription factor [Accumulibacter sp.]